MLFLSFKYRIKYYLAMPSYFISRFVRNKVYFGYYHFAEMVNPKRGAAMKQLVHSEVLGRTENYNILEIGSWAGSSAILWANQLKQQGVSGLVLCVDIWNVYGELSRRYRMRNALRNDAIFKLFQHNIRCSGCAEYIKYIRGKSSDVLPILKHDYFDLVYIDGSHKYSDVKQDIEDAIKVVKLGGIICGDDLDMQLDELPDSIDLERVRESEADIDGYEYVPASLGVTVAVSDIFGYVDRKEGFWFIRVTEDIKDNRINKRDFIK